MRILISGASGLIGTALSDSLRAAGHTVDKLVRRQPAAGEFAWDPKAGELDPAAFAECDAVINLSGAGIGDKRWTDDYKRELLESRVTATELLATTIAALDRKPRAFLSGSAVGCYGDRGDERLDELSALGNDFLSSICAAVGGRYCSSRGCRSPHSSPAHWHRAVAARRRPQEATPPVQVGPRWTLRRRASVAELDHDRRRRRRDPTSAHIRHPRRREPHCAEPGDQPRSRRRSPRCCTGPAVLPVPMLGPKLLLGSESSTTLLLSSQRALPTALLRSGFEFRPPHARSRPTARARDASSDH